jgi:hypothetical protein
MNPQLYRFAPRALAAALLVGGLSALAPAHVHGQYLPPGQASGGSVLRAPSTPGLERGGYVVVIDLDANRLHFTRNRRVLWSAPVGTGTGLRLESGDGKWDFSTPDGVFQVKSKQEDPVWYAPDWYFIENKLPVPPADSPKRRFPGGLGVAAVFLGNGLAIHGTDKPELLGQRVSHGCIRLSNRDALRLFHNVQIGTEIVIVGGERVREPDPAASAPKPTAQRTQGTAARKSSLARDPFLELLETLPTSDLLTALDEELAATRETRWPEVAGVLLKRGIRKYDDPALAGLLGRAGGLRGKVAQEYATFLADAYMRGALPTLRALADLPAARRRQAARAIVEASLALYPGDPGDRVAPWPTRRVPRGMLEPEAEAGWDALQAAEEALRGQGGTRTTRAER